MSNAIPAVASAPSVAVAPSATTSVIKFPVIIDVSAIPVPDRDYSPVGETVKGCVESTHPANHFTYPKPVVVTGPRSRVRVIKARHMLVVLDSDLADLYETTVDAVNRAVMRNACCFPRGICFRLSNDEWRHLQDKTNVGNNRGNWLCAPLVFTDEGALAVSKILDTFDATRGSVFVWRVIHNLESAAKAKAEQASTTKATASTCARKGKV